MSEEKKIENIIYFTKIYFNKKCLKKNKDKKTKINNTLKQSHINFFYYCIAYLLIDIIIKCEERMIKYNYSSIYLKVNGTGLISIISFHYNGNSPNKIIKNGIDTSIQKKIFFETSEININNITLIWNDEISNIASIF